MISESMIIEYIYVQGFTDLVAQHSREVRTVGVLDVLHHFCYRPLQRVLVQIQFVFALERHDAASLLRLRHIDWRYSLRLRERQHVVVVLLVAPHSLRHRLLRAERDELESTRLHVARRRKHASLVLPLDALTIRRERIDVITRERQFLQTIGRAGNASARAGCVAVLELLLPPALPLATAFSRLSRLHVRVTTWRSAYPSHLVLFADVLSRCKTQHTNKSHR